MPMMIQQCEEVDDTNYTSLTVVELKKICKDKGLKGYNKKTEKELIKMIKGVE